MSLVMRARWLIPCHCGVGSLIVVGMAVVMAGFLSLHGCGRAGRPEEVARSLRGSPPAGPERAAAGAAAARLRKAQPRSPHARGRGVSEGARRRWTAPPG